LYAVVTAFETGLQLKWILEAADLDEALTRARKGAVACRASGKVRELLFNPAPTQGPGGSK
jgi:hypothetical protein